MKTRYVAAASMLAGVALGALCVGALHAQNKAPGAYVVVTFTDVGDQKGFMENVGSKVPEIAEKHGGKYLVRTNEFTVLREGTPPFPLKHYILIGFDSIDAAKAWYNSPDMKDINAYAEHNTKGRAYVVPAFPD